jgi:hypothetical protein
VSSVDQLVIDLVEGVSIWGFPGLEVDSFVHEVCGFDRHLPACGKMDYSETIFSCTLMQAHATFKVLKQPCPKPPSVLNHPLLPYYKILLKLKV